MHIKFTKHGAGQAKRAAHYLLSKRDHQGIERAGLEVLRGNPEEVARIADSLDFKYRYTSGILAFSPEDNPTREQLNNLLDAFEKTAWAGLEPHRYAWSAVLHRDTDGGCHVHVFSARVDLETGKSLNIAPPGWQQTFDLLRDASNYENGWARPDDPERARLLQPGYHAYRDAASLRTGLERSSHPKQIITDYLTQRIEAGLISNRADLVCSLEEVGFEITRQGKRYISVRTEPRARPLRLKGVIYDTEFNCAKLERTVAPEDEDRSTADRNVNRERARSAYKALEMRCQQRADYHRARYLRADRCLEPDIDHEREEQREARRSLAMDDPPNVSLSVHHRDRTLHRHLHRELGSDAILDLSDPESDGHASSPRLSDRAPTRDLVSDRAADLGPSLDSGEKRSLHRSPETRSDRNGMDDWSQESHPGSLRKHALEIVRDIYDRFRTTVTHRLRPIIEAIRTGASATTATHRLFITAGDEAFQTTERATDTLRASHRHFTRGLSRMKQSRAEELERFKREISLADLALSYGYALDRQGSSRHSFVMRHTNGDKLILATGHDGHGVYFSVRDPEDHGTIIDFIQKRRDVSLREIRKELRQWRGISPSSEFVSLQKPLPTDPNRHRVFLAYAQTQQISYHPYLAHRGISKQTLSDSRFIDMVRRDSHGNAVFPHRDLEGLCGFELKNRDFTGFSRHGTKGLWSTSNLIQAKRLVVVESALDALSHAQVRQTGSETAYISVGGQLGHRQEQLIKKVLGRSKGVLELALDNDSAGHRLACQIASLAPENARIERHTPRLGKDWNEYLMRNLRLERGR